MNRKRCVKINKKTEKKHNLLTLIEMLRRYGAMSQARLKEFCGLQASTVSYLVNDLKQCGLIKDADQEQREGKVGKPGNLIELNNEMASFLGIYVEDDWIDAYWIGVDGKILEYKRKEFEEVPVVESIFQTIYTNLKAHGNVKGIGVAIKGIVYADGTIKSGNRNKEEAWNFEGVVNELKSRFSDIPIIVDNDANCVAELFNYNTKHTYSNSITYLLNQTPFGIGCGLTIENKIYRGTTGAAGEIFERSDLMAELADSVRQGNIYDAEKIIQIILPHILASAYLLNPGCIVITGSYFENMPQEELIRVREKLKQVPTSVEILAGEDHLNPAQGVALLAIDTYVRDLIEEVTR